MTVGKHTWATMARVLFAFLSITHIYFCNDAFLRARKRPLGVFFGHGKLAHPQECAKVAHDGHKHHEKSHSLASIKKNKLNGFTR